jgi:ferric-chelate reductase
MFNSMYNLLDARSPPSSTSPDNILSIETSSLYPKQMWYLVACVIALISVFQLGSFIHSKLAQRADHCAIEPHSNQTSTRHGTALRRIPLSIVNIYRVMAFRWTVELGGYSLNVAEVFLTGAYIVAMFTWTFINSECIKNSVSSNDG